jgi:hypothetical protein
MEMSKIYIVISGYYSDIEGVYDNPFDANLHMDRLPEGDSEIVEMNLNSMSSFLRSGKNVYCVHMRRSGAVDREIETISPRANKITLHKHKEQTWLSVWTWAHSSKEAQETANKERLRLIANGEWPDPFV